MTRTVAPTRELLERYLARFDVQAHLSRDPLRFPHRYRDPDDIETSAFLAASLAFGRVSAFGPVIEHMLRELGPSPATTLRLADRDERSRQALVRASSRPYRWLQTNDLEALLLALAEILTRHGSLEAAFESHDRPSEPDTWLALGGLLEEMKVSATTHHADSEGRSRALAFLFPSTRASSPCKRQHLFLRWMIRPRTAGADFGLWEQFDPGRLVIPCDVHVGRIGHALGLASRPEPSRRVAGEITDALRAIDPIDPIRFDFALSHLGISGGCRGRKIETICQPCTLRSACRWWVGDHRSGRQ